MKEQNTNTNDTCKVEELDIEMKGYGCDDDCQEFFEKTAGYNCGWKPTDNTSPLW